MMRKNRAQAAPLENRNEKIRRICLTYCIGIVLYPIGDAVRAGKLTVSETL